MQTLHIKRPHDDEIDNDAYVRGQLHLCGSLFPPLKNSGLKQILFNDY